jgi:hypothetical protein
MLLPVGLTGWRNRQSPTTDKVARERYEAFCKHGVLGSLPKPSRAYSCTCRQELFIAEGNPKHPSLQLKKVGRFWSVRVGARYRALAVDVDEGLLWFWIGSHADYDDLIN